MEKEYFYRKIYSDLLQGIKTGSFPPGSRVPSEKELAEQYGVSRITTKKALEMLAEQKLIERMPGRGSFVLEHDGESRESEKMENLLRENNKIIPDNPGNGRSEYGREESSQRESSQKEGSQRESSRRESSQKKGGREEGLPDKGGRDGSKGLIGVILDSFGVSYGCGLVNGMERECGKRGFHMILKCTRGSMEEESRAVDDLIALGVQGIILMCVQGENYNANVLRLSLEHFPIVLVDRELTGLPIPCVSTDHYQASRELMERLIEKGHTGICFLSHPFMQTSSVAARFSGYLDAMLEHGLMTNEEIWLKNLCGMNSEAEARKKEEADIEQIETFIREHPEITGFFAVDQLLGILAYKILCRMGLEKEKEVVFFDGPEEAGDFGFRLDYVVQDEELIGVRAVGMLTDLMEGREVPKKSFVPHKIVAMRAGCGIRSSEEPS